MNFQEEEDRDPTFKNWRGENENLMKTQALAPKFSNQSSKPSKPRAPNLHLHFTLLGLDLKLIRMRDWDERDEDFLSPNNVEVEKKKEEWRGNNFWNWG